VPIVEVHVSLVGRSDLADEIYRQMRTAIATGQLGPGDVLPPSRELARRLSVSRGTVAVAYDRLSGEGYLTTRVGAGTFVSDRVPRGQRAHGTAGGVLRPRALWDRIPLPSAFVQPARYDFRTGLPDATRFPFQTWRRLLAQELRPKAVGRGYYGEPAGHAGLRDALARHVGAARGVIAKADHVIVTNGTQQALDLITRVLLAPGGHVAVEDPGYAPPRRLFTALGLEVSGVPLDDEGLVVDALPESARIVYVTPSHQYPLGVVMSLPRRIALLQWADRHDAAIIEDDYDSEFRYSGRPIEPLRALDANGRVIYVGSFSKTMLTTLRLGFLIAPPSLVPALHAAKSVTDWHTPLPTQAALAAFIEQGHFARHIRRMRLLYQRRHDLVIDTVTRRLSDQLTIIPSLAGLHITALATTASADETDEVARRAQATGVAVQPLSMFRVDGPPRAGFALGYGAIETDDISHGLHRLHGAFLRRRAG
jgi:GntR family transcriptional regulator / MocR family aminotransferase